MVKGRPWLAVLLAALASVAVLPVGLAAQESADADPAPTLAGRMDLAVGFLSPDPALELGAANPWTVTAGGSGRLSLGVAGRSVKPELRLSWSAGAREALSLDRAWIKFRFPGFRGTFGLGRLGWGPGLVLNPGDLLFDSSSLSATLGDDEPRSQGKWLADAWLALADEAYLEGMAVLPAAVPADPSLPGVLLPDRLEHLAGGLRSALDLAGMGVEAAVAADGLAKRFDAALSAQFHLGIDWYLTGRISLPEPESRFGAGCFGLVDLGGGASLSTRHEVLVRPRVDWLARGADGSWALGSYHELSLGLPEHLSLSLRDLLSPFEPSSLLMAEIAWAPLDGLRISLAAAFRIGAAGSSWAWQGPGAASLGLGFSTSW